MVSDTDPGDSGGSDRLEPCRPLRPRAARTAGKVNEFVHRAHRLLEAHPVNARRIREGSLPANGIITRGAGAAFEVDNVLHARGIDTAVVAGCNTVLGLARLLGFETITDPRFTAAPDTDLDAKLQAALTALDHHQLVYLHIKAPDLFSHDRDPAGKRRFLERVDRSLQGLQDHGAVIAVTADHSTDSNTGAHTDDPVPSLIHAPDTDTAADRAEVNFGETACRQGSMPRQQGSQFLLRVIESLGY